MSERRKLHQGGQPKWNRAHIRELGLKNVEQYRAWCREHGFPVKPEKSWREEREELRLVERQQADVELDGHIEALGLVDREAYRAWCRECGFSDSFEKGFRQRRRELELAAKLQEKERGEKSAGTGESDTVDPEHIEALGLANPEAYRGWCRERGLSEALNKSEKQLRRERELAALNAVKRQRNRPGEVIEKICAGEIREEDLQADYLRKIHAAFAALKGEEERGALRGLLVHASRCTGWLEKGMAVPRLGEVEGNSFVEGLITLGRHWWDWVRLVEEWRPKSHNLRRQFGSLARHLLARYDIPPFMDLAWFAGDDEAARRQQAWFVHIGSGGNIRTADIPVRFSKKMAHCFFEAPAGSTIEEALRWGQVTGQGGGEYLADAVLRSRLSRSFKNEDFWEKVIIFLVEQPMLDPAWVGPIVDYIYRQKYDRQEVVLPGGQVEYRDPPESNFGMKSRSIFKLLRQVEVQQAQVTKEQKARRRLWKSSGMGDFSYTEFDEETGQELYWTVQELLSTRELHQEGKAMRHCVSSYGRRCQSGKISVWSLQVEDPPEEPRRVMTIAVDNKRRYISQTRGRFNALHGFALDDDGIVPIREDAYDGNIRSTSRLGRRDRYYLQKAPTALYLWMVHEGIK